MTALTGTDLIPEISETNSIQLEDNSSIPCSSSQRSSHRSSTKGLSWSTIFGSTFSFFETNSSSAKQKEIKARNYGWTAAMKKTFTGEQMRRLQERFFWTSRVDLTRSTSEVWLLGTCYKVQAQASSDANKGLDAFLEDFSSKIWITYRKGFNAIVDSQLTSDVNWGCMIRCSQMLVAQAMIFHHLGRTWRKPSQKPYDSKYIRILQLFGDSEESSFSIHNLLEAGRSYGLAAGQWVGPYAICRTWESLARTKREHLNANQGDKILPMVFYVISGEDDGERGGAPVLYVNIAARLSSDFGSDQTAWAPMLLLVPLVLGLEKINPRYVPLLCESFTFPQSLGILGGKPGASTYIIGVQDDKALYLDPHEVQPVVDIKSDSLEADTSSYHCSTVRHMSLELIDPSMALGFYCRDRDDFDDFCIRASKLAEKSNGAPLFTVAQTYEPSKTIGFGDNGIGNGVDAENCIECENRSQEDEWQIL